jgi:hypothetical protein
LKKQKDWQHKGPYNLRSFNILKEPTGILADFKQFLQSEEFAQYLSLITGLQPISSDFDICEYLPGQSYTLAHDNDPEMRKEGLDVMVCLMPEQEWDSEEHGGSRHYVLAGEEEELVTIEPRANCLAIVYRDKVEDHNGGLLHFTRFVNHTAPSSIFQYQGIYRLQQEESEPESSGKYEKDSD